jgi:cytidine deaminase
MDPAALIEAAKSAAEHSYSPYSCFRVGAALLCTDGTVFTGTNVENASYGLTNCAERSAVFSAVSSGYKDFAAIAVYSPDSTEPVPPCGACRQVLSEFVDENFPVHYGGTGGKFRTMLFSKLFPESSLPDLIT